MNIVSCRCFTEHLVYPYIAMKVVLVIGRWLMFCLRDWCFANWSDQWRMPRTKDHRIRCILMLLIQDVTIRLTDRPCDVQTERTYMHTGTPRSSLVLFLYLVKSRVLISDARVYIYLFVVRVNRSPFRSYWPSRTDRSRLLPIRIRRVAIRLYIAQAPKILQYLPLQCGVWRINDHS